MSEKAAALRALALSRASKQYPYHLVLDDDIRAGLAELNDALDQLQTHRQKLVDSGDLPAAKPASLGEKPVAMTADIDRHIQTVTEQIAEAEQAARESGTVLVLNFHRLTPDGYQQHVEHAEALARKQRLKDKNTDEGDAFLRTLGDELIRDCYTGAATVDGDDVDLPLSDLLEHTLNHVDVALMRNHCISINREPQSVPFNQASSGVPAQS